ncbi:MAG: hypothetical protein HY561_08655 [Gemmatimonadetes bacterium]|nr:hypothetical protein [Gemmatimonadota bacterium]
MLPMGHRGMAPLLATGLLALATTACVTRTTSAPDGARGSPVTPALIVERFLNAANSVAQLSAAGGSSDRVVRELETMGRLFGTREGPILERDPRADVERRMYLIANVLRHDDYTLAGERPVPGRTGAAIEVVVRLTMGERQVDVPFTLVRTGGDAWLVEQIDLQRITARP